MLLLCLGEIMIVLDTTIVNVALPSIRAELGFSEAALAWVINAYMLTYGGFLLLGGRLGDLYGHKRLFRGGVALFTVASLACGLARSQTVLITARAIQGLGGAVVSAVALSLITELFTEPNQRAKAMGVFGFTCASGGSVGVLIGGALTTSLGWHWNFFVNVPVGLVVCLLSLRLLPTSDQEKGRQSLDVIGAVTITTSLLFAVYAVVNGNDAGWRSQQTLGLLGVSALLLATFLYVESRVYAPLVPLRLLRLRNLAISNVIAVLWAAAMFAWFFLSALYLQLVLGYSPMKVGLAFLPANLIMAAFSLGLSARIVMRYGVRAPIAFGMFLVVAGLALFARAPVEGNFWLDVIPVMTLVGLGAGVEFNPVLLAAMNDVTAQESGLASGVVNTSFMMGGALGLAVLASIASARTHQALARGTEHLLALTAGYPVAFLAGAGFALLAALSAALLLRPVQDRVQP